MDVSNRAAAAGGDNGFQGEPTPATHATVYATAYSDIPVFEAMVRNVAVMMRRSDMWLNATQILKVAGVNKTARTKYLDREISKGTHQKIQGGYGKYQGTWVPYQTGVDLARTFGVLGLLEPVFSLQAHAAQLPLSTPQLPQATYPLQNNNNNSNNNAGSAVPAAPGPGQGRTLAGTGGMGMMLGQPGSAAGGMMMTQPQMPFGNPTMDNSGSAIGTGQPLRTPGSGVSFDVGSSSMGHLQQAQGIRHPAYEQPGPESMMYGAGVQMGQPGAASYYPVPGTSYQPTTMIQGYSAPGVQSGGARSQLKRPLEGEMGQLDQSNGTQAGLGPGPGLYVDQYGRSFMVESDAGAQPPPLKRARPETYGAGFGEADNSIGAQAVVEDDSRAIPVGTRLAVRPSRPRHLDAIGSPGGNVGDVASLAMSDHRARTKLLAIFEAKETTEVDLDVLLAPSPSKPKREAGRQRADDDDEDEDEEHNALVMDDEDEDDDKDMEIDIDQVIDDRGHTVLHWAAALARDGIIAQLIKRGADVHRGNFSGETPLIRAILTTNNADRNTLSILLDRYLGASVRTIDNTHRSVLHHIALVAGIKGRATSANYYMSTLLEWIARHEEDSGIKSFVNAKDMQGDTALNVAARVGDKNLVKLLLDAGADPSRANKIGLRPVDYGLEVPGLEVANGYPAAPMPDVFSQVPYTKGSDLLKRLSNMIQQLNNDFRQEIGTKQSNLDQIHAQVVLVTRELAEERRKITAAQNLVKQVEAAQQQAHDLEQILPLESVFEWHPGQTESLAQDSTVDPTFEPSNGPKLVQLRRIRTWQRRTEGLLDQKMVEVESASAQKMAKYRKVIATCVKLPVEKIDEKLLEELTKAIDTDGALLDSSKMTAFIQRVNGE